MPSRSGRYAGFVLAVAVDLGGDVVAVAERVLEAGLHRAPDPGVERMAQDHRAAGLGLGRAVVGRAVVDHDDVEARRLAMDLTHHPADHPLLVVGRDDRELAEVGAVARHLGCEGGSGAGTLGPARLPGPDPGKPVTGAARQGSGAAGRNRERGRTAPKPLRRGRRGAGAASRRGGVEFNRIVAFSDGVFAIAITLLGARPPDSRGAVQPHPPRSSARRPTCSPSGSASP